MRIIVSLLTMTLIATGAHAQNRCVENGKTMYTDRPCGSEPIVPIGAGQQSTKVIGDSANGGYSTTTGIWRGQAQFQATSGGQVVAEAHAVVPMTIEIDPQGKVTGISSDNGCRMLGVASPGVMPTMANLDVTFSGCNYPGFNRRMSGYLALYQAQKHAQLSLNGSLIVPGRIVATYDVKATMRR